MFSYLKDNIFNLFKRRELEKKGLLQTRKRMKQGGTLGTVFEKSKTVWIFILLAVWVVCVGVMLFPDSEDLSISFVESQQATSTVFSEFDFSYIDAEKTRIRRENAVSEEPVIYRIDAQLTESLLNLTSEFFEEFAKSGGKGAVIISDGFSECGNQGLELAVQALGGGVGIGLRIDKQFGLRGQRKRGRQDDPGSARHFLKISRR